MTVDAFRESVINFAITLFESFAKIEHNYKSEEIVCSYYSINKVPTGYIKNISYFSESVCTQIWSKSNNKYISLNQVPFHVSNNLNIEHNELSEIAINDISCLTGKDNNLYYCYWEFDGCRFELVYPLDLGEEFMSEVVGHLVEVDPEELTTE